jgi:hypothetical protein
MSLAKTLLTAFVSLSLAATALAQIRPAAITGAVTDQSGTVAANEEVVTTNSKTNVSFAGFMPLRETGRASATHQTARADVKLKVHTAGAIVEVAAQAAQIQTNSSALSNATDAQVIDAVTNVTQNPLFYAMLQNGVQPHNQTSTSTLGDL